MVSIGKIKQALKKIRFLYPVYARIKVWWKDELQKRRLRGEYTFENRSKNSTKLCVVLAGYKEYLYPAIFGRLKHFAPEDMDVCILTSGLYSPGISKICEQNGWSYLSTKKNQVCLIQNIAIDQHPHADYIFKLDEDIFITEGYFENMLAAYDHAWQGDYQPGVIAPLIPVNGYGNVRILRKLDLVTEYKRRFEEPKHSNGDMWQVESNFMVARFFWGEGGFVPSIDEMNARFSLEERIERPCPIRFSIGAILYRRELWQTMGYFPVNYFKRYGTGMGQDEVSICQHCCFASRPLMVSENVVVGHLSFARQNAAMKEYYLNHTELFLLP